MEGYYIEAQLMTPEMAAEIDRLVSQVSVNADSAEALLSLRASLRRIADGSDIVVSAENNSEGKT